MKNIDPQTVDGFGAEWARFDQQAVPADELAARFEDYFHLMPWNALPQQAEGFDAGCGSGRWAALVAPRVGTLHCIDASAQALEIARRNLMHLDNCRIAHASVQDMPMPDGAMDFGYSLGVLHHLPDTATALAACVRKLKRGAPFVLYLYYALDNRPLWFRWLWRVSDVIRRAVSRLPDRTKIVITDIIAVIVYWPLARSSALLEKLGLDVDRIPLSYYRTLSLYSMRTDARDRFGTPLEQRFTATEIEAMMEEAGLCDIRFSDRAPYWIAIGWRRP